MTWRSGPCSDVPGGGSAWVSDGDGYVRIDDADVRADEAERVRVTLDESVGFPPVEHGLYEP